MDLATFNQLLSAAVNSGASDIHIKADAPPAIRVGGQLRELRMPALKYEDTHRIAVYLTREHQVSSQLQNVRELSVSYSIPDLARFRVVLFRQRGSFAAVLHTVPSKPQSIEELRLPEVLKEIAELPQGLILCTSLPGQGRSTTMAALIQHINQHHKRHVVTIEDPVEFVFEDRLSRVTQREIGRDTASYAEALHSAMHIDPDVLMVEEVADAEVLDMLLRAAEAGYTVLTSLTTPTVYKSLERLLRLARQDSRKALLQRLSSTLGAICSQHLVGQVGGKGRFPVLEIYRQTPELVECVRQGNFQEIPNLLESQSSTHKTQSLNQHLEQAQKSGQVDSAQADALLAQVDSGGWNPDSSRVQSS